MLRNHQTIGEKTMKAFASDLDRTLIFSKKMLEQFPSQEPVELVERYEGKELSYISTKTKEHLLQLKNEVCFLPVTTRTTAQYRRIDLFQHEIKPEFAITANGAVILKNNHEVAEWSEKMRKDLTSLPSLQEVMQEAEALPIYDSVKKVRVVENYFFYYIVDPTIINHVDPQTLQAWGRARRWQVSWQGRKIYFIPEVINKWRAVQYLKEQLGWTAIVSAGDSYLDQPLVQNADRGIVPKHGELLNSQMQLSSTRCPGIKASIEITKQAIEGLLKKEVDLT
ncbi:hydrolase (had superfamily) [Halobacillus salinarum]|uniref:Hydrolase (Had superfamily) n=1 Tax=Halobacillus salinarum TaxID=2932257 RepID=A0ABY4EIN3_9BACI|nr:HAD family hydrolase [Halobacillus salinarum]UOQ43951.1 hydrolase (had superfamily) [Halobacillus salinarum]